MATTIQMGWRFYSDTAALSGGSWLTSLPLANLQDPVRSLVARSANVLQASTLIDIDFGQVRNVCYIAALKHNFSQTGTYEVTAGSAPGGNNIYASGFQQIWAATPTLDMAWEDPNWWWGTKSAEEVEGYPIDLIHDIGSIIRTRYMRLAIKDTSNPAGYAQAARLLAGPLYVPPTGYLLGAKLDWEGRSESKVSLGGVRRFDRRQPVRVFRFQLPALTDSDAYGQILELRRIASNHGEVLLITNKDDATYGFKRNFVGFVRESDALEQFARGYHRTGLVIEELP